AYGMRELETVITLADFLHKCSVLIEFPQPRVRAAEVNKNVTLGIRCDSYRFAQSLAGRDFQQIRYDRVSDFRDIQNRGFLLCGGRARTQQQQSGDNHQRKTRLHWALRVESATVYQTELLAKRGPRICRLDSTVRNSRNEAYGNSNGKHLLQNPQ